MSLRTVISFAAAACLVGAYAAQPARADDAPKHPIWSGTPVGDIQFSGHTELGLSINPDSPGNGQNFGQPFTNGANAFRMNQSMLTVEHDTDSSATGFDYGFKVQAMYGTDSRLTHFYNEFDRSTESPYQWDVNYLEANVHTPAFPLVSGGSDLQIGEYATPLGYEVIDATGNPFYSHSYTFTYGLPYKHTGILGTFHVTDLLDIWGGWDTGVNDSFVAAKGNANPSLLHGIVGFGLNGLAGGNLTIIGLAHFGAENPSGSSYLTPSGATHSFDAANLMSEYYDANAVWKINDSWTSVTEVNMIHNDAYGATGAGFVQYAIYTLNDQWTLQGRAEAYSDQSKGNGFNGFVCDYPNSQDAVDGERNIPLSTTGNTNGTYCGNTNTVTSGAASNAFNAIYSEFTVGASYTPTWPPLPGTWGLTIRPEARFDTLLASSHGVKPFDVSTTGIGSKTSQVTLAVDAILAF